jgi:hypothetical protein
VTRRRSVTRVGPSFGLIAAFDKVRRAAPQ